MKYVSLLACVLFSIHALAARSPRLKDEVTKIAVGPRATPAPAEGPSPEEGDAADADATDAVDKPIRKPVVITTDAPGAHGEADVSVTAAPHPTPIPTPAPKRGTVAAPAPTPTPVSVESDDGEDEAVAPAQPAKIDTSKSKAEVLKMRPAPAGPVREEKAEDAKPVTTGVTAEQSLKWLENGNVRYTTHKFRADGRGEKERAKKEVKPHAIVLSCSDSRVPPELIFDQGLGEIVTIRVAGEVLDSSVIASIEEAIQNDHPHLLVVLGHTRCSAIEAAFSWKETASFGSDALDRMVSEMKPHFKTLTSPTRSPDLQIESALQADGVARDLTERSEIIKKAVHSGELTIKTGLYWVDSGKVKFY